MAASSRGSEGGGGRAASVRHVPSRLPSLRHLILLLCLCHACVSGKTNRGKGASVGGGKRGGVRSPSLEGQLATPPAHGDGCDYGGSSSSSCWTWPVAPKYHLGTARSCSRRDPILDYALLLLHPTSTSTFSTPLQTIGAAFREVLAWLPPDTTPEGVNKWAEVLWGSAHLRLLSPPTPPSMHHLLRAAEALSAEVVLLIWGDDTAWLSSNITHAVMERFRAAPSLGLLSITSLLDAPETNTAQTVCSASPDAPLLNDFRFHAPSSGHIAVRRRALLAVLNVMTEWDCGAETLSEAMWAARSTVATLNLPHLPPPTPHRPHTLPCGARSSLEHDPHSQMSRAACHHFRQRISGQPISPTECAAFSIFDMTGDGRTVQPSPRWTIVVQYFRQPNFLPRLISGLRAVVRATDGGVELIVMDDSASEVAEWVAGLEGLAGVVDSSLLVVANNLHEIRSYNVGARLARAELLALLQDDDNPGAEAGWLRSAGRLMAAHPGMALLGGHRGRMDCAADGGDAVMDPKRRMADGLKFGPRRIPIPTVDPTTRLPFMFAYKVNAAPLIVRRSVLLQLGGLHRELSCPGEAGIGFDFELSVRMWAEGHKVGLFYSGFDRVAHSGGEDAGGGAERGGKAGRGTAGAVMVSGTRANKGAHKARIANYHANNAALYALYPALHHRNGTLRALAACRTLTLSAATRNDPQWVAFLSASNAEG